MCQAKKIEHMLYIKDKRTRVMCQAKKTICHVSRMYQYYDS